MNALEISNLTFGYESYSFLRGSRYEKVLDDVNFEIKIGQKMGLMGLSGCGKSTLASIIMGLNTPQSGKIKFYNKTHKLDTLSKRREFYKMAQIVFQDPISAINPSFSVKQVLSEPLNHLSKLNERQKDEQIMQICEKTHIKHEYLNKPALSLSGGELGRVNLARALIIKPKFLILDESLSAFDLPLQAEILKLLDSLEGMSYLFITHDFRLARAFCDEIMLMQKGKIIEKIGKNQDFSSELGVSLKNAIL
ncbi:Nickel import ATP-binding protein NikE [Campylobacter majalis]|uniref:Nickel import ATP-binding protein NikE n=1 Tax=Campylobacter majalis TaxID=2790656 RepID=A0ABM8Q5N0_9BACT|nr:dipeptide/oligopeptide/nickel ABC transporter ATP-binding protein [Campylobacter majalis]CAD7288137.1 Nickel import ATP-binding protein NikE [Campylobacter majalis]